MAKSRFAPDDPANIRKLRTYAKARRGKPTAAEKAFWEMVRKKALGVRFHREAPLIYWIADFYCPRAKLVVEIDGSYHEGRQAYDERRTRAFQRLGLFVVRYHNLEVLGNREHVKAHLMGLIAVRTRPDFRGLRDPRNRSRFPDSPRYGHAG